MAHAGFEPSIFPPQLPRVLGLQVCTVRPAVLKFSELSTISSLLVLSRSHAVLSEEGSVIWALHWTKGSMDSRTLTEEVGGLATPPLRAATAHSATQPSQATGLLLLGC